jgi:DNA polymerase-4
VRIGQRRGSIGSQRALGRPTRSLEEIDATVVAIVDRVTRRMRAAGRIGRTVVLRLRFADFSRATRSHSLPRATSQTETVLATARWLLALATPVIEREGLTLVGIAVGNLESSPPVQLALGFRRQDGTALDTALDAIRDRFGTSAVTRAVLVGRSQGVSMPLLPD